MPRCSKRSYESENAANYRLTVLWRKFRTRSRLITERHAYECRKCGRWHLTSE